MIAAALRVLRPHAEVETTTLDALGDVICNRPNTVDPGGRIAWVELSIDPTQPTRVCVGGRYAEPTNPTLEVLLAVIDEVEELVRTNDHHRRC